MEDKIKLFTKEVSPAGKVIYKHIENGAVRIKLINEYKSGKITLEEMHKLAKKAKYLYSENEYYRFIN